MAEAKKGERRTIRFRIVLVTWSFDAEIDEARLVGMERELVPSETLAQNVQDPLGVLEVPRTLSLWLSISRRQRHLA